MKRLTKEQRKTIKIFDGLFSVNFVGLKKSARLYASTIAKAPEMKAVFKDRYPQIQASIWDDLVRIAKGTIDSRLLTLSTDYARRLKYLPISDQKRALDKKLSVIIDGEIRRRKIEDLSQVQIRQLIAPNYLRNIKEQQAFIQEVMR